MVVTMSDTFDAGALKRRPNILLIMADQLIGQILEQN